MHIEHDTHELTMWWLLLPRRLWPPIELESLESVEDVGSDVDSSLTGSFFKSFASLPLVILPFSSTCCFTVVVVVVVVFSVAVASSSSLPAFFRFSVAAAALVEFVTIFALTSTTASPSAAVFTSGCSVVSVSIFSTSWATATASSWVLLPRVSLPDRFRSLILLPASDLSLSSLDSSSTVPFWSSSLMGSAVGAAVASADEVSSDLTSFEDDE